MKLVFLTLCLILSQATLAKVVIIDKEDGKIELTGLEAKRMTETILQAPVNVTATEYILTIKTVGLDFNYNEQVFLTGEITCLKNGKKCTVKGSKVRENNDGWFSPAAGYARVFGLGTLSDLDKKGYFNCNEIYEDIACDFKL